MDKVYLEENGREELETMFESFLKGEKQGIIELAFPCMNIAEWYTPASRQLEALLGMDRDVLERIVYFSDAVVESSETDDVSAGDIVNDSQLRGMGYSIDSGDLPFSLLHGAEAVQYLLNNVDIDAIFQRECPREKELMATLEEMYAKLDDETCWADPDSKISYNDEVVSPVEDDLDACRSRLLAAEYYSGAGKGRLFIDNVRLFPTDIRGMVRNAQKVYPAAADDLFRLYQGILFRNHRVRRLTEMGAPLVILRNERRMLQEGVDALVANGARGNAKRRFHKNSHVLKSLSDIMLVGSSVI